MREQAMRALGFGLFVVSFVGLVALFTYVGVALGAMLAGRGV